MILFVDCQNLYHRCKDHFAWPWAHPLKLGHALVEQDRQKYGPDSHVLTGVRYYTGIHDPNRNPQKHAIMARRLRVYDALGVYTAAIPLRFNRTTGRWEEKGVDVRIALDLVRLGTKGLYDVAIIVSEDSDLNEAAKDVYELRDHERWIAVENALPWSPNSHAKWLADVKRRRRITKSVFDHVEDRNTY